MTFRWMLCLMTMGWFGRCEWGVSCWFGCVALHYQAGGSPAATHFLLLRQKKVSKEKATLLPAEFLGSEPKFAEPLARPAGAVRRTAAKLVSDPNNSPCGAQSSRGLVQTRCAQTSTSPDPSGPPLLSACRRGGETNTNSQTPQNALCAFCSPIPFFCPKPVLAGPVLRKKSGIRAARCLSRRRVCADPRFSCAAQVARSAAQGPRLRVAFLLGTFLWRSKEKCLARRGETRPGDERHTLSIK